MSIKAKLEAIIYAAEDPITLDQMASLLKDDLLALKTALPVVERQSAAESQTQPEEDHLGAVEESAPEPSTRKTREKSEKVELRGMLRPYLDELIADYANPEHGIEIREVASGYRMSTKPEHHDVVRAFSKSLKPPIRLSLQALETLAVIAYKQPVTVPEISDIRGVDSSAVIGTLFDRKLVTTAGRKSVVGRPMLYKTTKDFLMRFGLSDLNELPSIEEFEKLAIGDGQGDLFDSRDAAIADATGVPDSEEVPEAGSEAVSAETSFEGSEHALSEESASEEVAAEAAAVKDPQDSPSEEETVVTASSEHASEHVSSENKE